MFTMKEMCVPNGALNKGDIFDIESSHPFLVVTNDQASPILKPG